MMMIIISDLTQTLPVMILLASAPVLPESHESVAPLRQSVGDALHDRPSVFLAPRR